MGREFANIPGVQGSISCRVIRKTQKWYLIPPCLIISIIRYVSMGKVEHLDVVTIEKGAFGSPSTMVANFIFIYIYIYIKGFCIKLPASVDIP